MDHDYAVSCIVEGMHLYFRMFGLADNMQHHSEGIEWIAPLPGHAGPSVVYRVSLDERSAAEQIEEMLPDLRSGAIPALWVISPGSTPANVAGILRSKGFEGGQEPEESDPGEPGMGLDMRTVSHLPSPNPRVEVREVQSLHDFGAWIDVVNEALHGWPMLTTEHYYPWLSRDELSFYTACIGGAPVSTVCTIRDGKRASIEFMSTLKPYRRRGAGAAVLIAALHGLADRGVEVATLRSMPMAISLYTKLGFRPYYKQVCMSFAREQ